MMQKWDFSTASSESIISTLGQRLEAIRLSQNISQADLAAAASVSRSTITRLADGQGISLDSFVRILQALGLGDHLAALLPDPRVRPVDRVRLEGKERQRARARTTSKDILETPGWVWGDEGDGA